MDPIVNGVEAEFAGQVKVIRLNVNEPANQQLQAHYTLRGHPTFVVLDYGGNVSQRFIGPQTAEVLRAAMAAVRP
ncbi:MAG: thioredoxin family protein [Chloroflexota bacterium]